MVLGLLGVQGPQRGHAPLSERMGSHLVQVHRATLEGPNLQVVLVCQLLLEHQAVPSHPGIQVLQACRYRPSDHQAQECQECPKTQGILFHLWLPGNRGYQELQLHPCPLCTLLGLGAPGVLGARDHQAFQEDQGLLGCPWVLRGPGRGVLGVRCYLVPREAREAQNLPLDRGNQGNQEVHRGLDLL